MKYLIALLLISTAACGDDRDRNGNSNGNGNNTQRFQFSSSIDSSKKISDLSDEEIATLNQETKTYTAPMFSAEGTKTFCSLDAGALDPADHQRIETMTTDQELQALCREKQQECIDRAEPDNGLKLSPENAPHCHATVAELEATYSERFSFYFRRFEELVKCEDWTLPKLENDVLFHPPLTTPFPYEHYEAFTNKCPGFIIADN